MTRTEILNELTSNDTDKFIVDQITSIVSDSYNDYRMNITDNGKVTSYVFHRGDNRVKSLHITR